MPVTTHITRTRWTPCPPPTGTAGSSAARSPNASCSSYRAATRKAYARDLKDFGLFCRQTGITPITASRADIELYARAMEANRGWQPRPSRAG